MESGETGDAGLWQARAAAWELLALSFRYPDEVLADAVTSGEWAAAACELAEALDLALPEGFASDARAVCKLSTEDETVFEICEEGTSSESPLFALRVEATRLFVGAPRPVCSPYEGVWRKVDDGVWSLLFVNPHALAVERFCESCGLGHPEGTREPLDHVYTECEFLEHLALRERAVLAGDAEAVDFGNGEALPAPEDLPGGSPAAAYQAFFDEHARTWMPSFAASVIEESRHPFFRAAASLLAAMVG